MFAVWLLLIRQENDDLSCMTDVKKTDVWFRKMLLMTCLQQLETNCQTNRNSFLLQTSSRKRKFCLGKYWGEKDLSYLKQTKSFPNMKAKFSELKFSFLSSSMFRMLWYQLNYQSITLDHCILLFSERE